MTQGIYFLANDRVLDDAIALLNSLQRHAPQYPVCLIPYDDCCARLSHLVRTRYRGQVLENPALFEELLQHGHAILHRHAPALRKFACWFGPFDEFVYLDADTVVLRGLDDVFDLLRNHDMVISADGLMIATVNVFTPSVLDDDLFNEQELADAFNTGFFASRKGILERERLDPLLRTAAEVPSIFMLPFQDQPLINYVALKAIPNRADLRHLRPTVLDDVWAGTPDIQIIGGAAYKPYDNQMWPVRHIHWAGFHRISERPHIRLWLMYRYPGRLGIIQRMLRRTAWVAERLIRRILAMDRPKWYHPRFQIKRLQRILKRRLDIPVRSEL